MKHLGGFECCSDRHIYCSQWWKLMLWSSILWHCIVWDMGNKFWRGKLPPFSGYKWTKLGEWLLICKWAPEGSTGQSQGNRTVWPRLDSGNHRPWNKELFQGKKKSKNFPSAGREGRETKSLLGPWKEETKEAFQEPWAKQSQAWLIKWENLFAFLQVVNGSFHVFFRENIFKVFKGPVSKGYINNVFTGQ